MICFSINRCLLSHLSQLSHLQVRSPCTTLLFCLSCLSYSLVIVTLGATVCHTVHQTALLENVHFNELGLWLLLHHPYWTLTENPLGYPAATQSHGNLAAMVAQDYPFHTLQQLIDGVDVLRQPSLTVSYIFSSSFICLSPDQCLLTNVSPIQL